MLTPIRRAIRFGARRLLGGRQSVRWLAARAVAARHEGDWEASARLLGSAVALAPARHRLRVQYGHALKEAGNRLGAIEQYRIAAGLNLTDLDVRVHWAALLRHLGEEVAAAQVYEEMLRIEPANSQARSALAELGRRSEHRSGHHGAALVARDAATVDKALRDLAVSRRVLEEAAVFPGASYALFRRCFPPVPPAVANGDGAPIDVVVVAGTAIPAMIRLTLDSIADQRRRPNSVTVLAGPDLSGHPVASPGGRRSPEPRFAGSVADALSTIGTGHVLLVGAGCWLDQVALEWFDYAADRTGSDLVYADHDTREEDWREGDVRSRPQLFCIHDKRLIEATRAMPPCVLTSAASVAGVLAAPAASWNERVRGAILGAERPLHVPRVLASFYEAPQRADLPRADEANRHAAIAATIITGTDTPSPERIAIIIPTRDAIAMLTDMVASLKANAARPDHLCIMIADNQSREDDSAKALAALGRDGCTIMDIAEPFNWSRINNVVARVADAPLLVFANNDMKMLSRGWDDVVRHHLGRDDVGAIGAQLLYPDNTYQHAGVVFGLDPRWLAMHEGIGHSASDPGPGDRWHVVRAAAAVTGAFLATTATEFNRLGGFDEELAVAYNDLDYCFKVREAGRQVLYVPDIRLTHYESYTRGRNAAGAQVAWDEHEQAVFGRRWGSEASRDPGYNPQWARYGQPFDGFREPRWTEIAAVIDRSATGQGWRTRREHGGAEGTT